MNVKNKVDQRQAPKILVSFSLKKLVSAASLGLKYGIWMLPLASLHRYTITSILNRNLRLTGSFGRV
jgi:hypothetical protein